jgi:hypothetical protein
MIDVVAGNAVIEAQDYTVHPDIFSASFLGYATYSNRVKSPIALYGMPFVFA